MVARVSCVYETIEKIETNVRKTTLPSAAVGFNKSVSIKMVSFCTSSIMIRLNAVSFGRTRSKIFEIDKLN